MSDELTSGEGEDKENEWKQEQRLRLAMMKIQHAETLVMAADFSERNRLIREEQLARLEVDKSLPAHRAKIEASFDQQTAAFERIAVALEKIANP